MEKIQEKHQLLTKNNNSDPVLVLRKEVNQLQIALQETQNTCARLQTKQLESLRETEQLEVATRSDKKKAQENAELNVEKCKKMEQVDLRRMRELQKYKQDIRHYQGLLANLGVAIARPPTPPPPMHISTQTSFVTIARPKRKMSVLAPSSTFKNRKTMNNDDDDDDDNTSNASNTIENLIRLSGDEDEDVHLMRDASTHSISLIHTTEKDGRIWVDRGVSPFFSLENEDYLIDEFQEYDDSYLNNEQETDDDDDDNNDEDNEEDNEEDNNNRKNSDGKILTEKEQLKRKTNTKRSKSENRTRRNSKKINTRNRRRKSHHQPNKRQENTTTSLSESSVRQIESVNSNNLPWNAPSDDDSPRNVVSISPNSRTHSRVKSSKNQRIEEETEETRTWEESKSRASSYSGATSTPLQRKAVHRAGVGRIIVDQDSELLGFPSLLLPRPQIMQIGEGSFLNITGTLSQEKEEDDSERDLSNVLNRFMEDTCCTIAVQTDASICGNVNPTNNFFDSSSGK